MPFAESEPDDAAERGDGCGEHDSVGEGGRTHGVAGRVSPGFALILSHLTRSFAALYTSLEAMSVDLTSAVRFDLRRGIVNLDQRAVLLSELVLANLLAAAGPDASALAGRVLGAGMGNRIAARFGGAEAVRAGPLEGVLSALAGEVSVSGFGTVSIERWGRAMVLVVENAPRVDGGFVASMLQGAIEAAVTSASSTASEQQIRCLALSSADPMLRVLVASGRGVERVRMWLAEGIPWGDALARLQATRARPR